LGRGVVEVGLERREVDQATRIEGSHDGYVRAYGHVHKRILILRNDGLELRGEDTLLPEPKAKQREQVDLHIRFHLGPDIETALSEDGRNAVLRLPDGTSWTFTTTGGTLGVEDSIWVDENGRPHPSQQLVIAALAPKGGITIGWLLRFLG
jgi:uncharacterized heparinase superfamily protein